MAIIYYPRNRTLRISATVIRPRREKSSVLVFDATVWAWIRMLRCTATWHTTKYVPEVDCAVPNWLIHVDTLAFREMLYNQQVATALQSLCNSLFIVGPGLIIDSFCLISTCYIDDTTSLIIQLGPNTTKLFQEVQMGVQTRLWEVSYYTCWTSRLFEVYAYLPEHSASMSISVPENNTWTDFTYVRIG